MMNPIEKLRQIQIDQRLIAGLQMLRCLSDRSVSAPTRTEAMAAVMESRLEDRLQNLEHGLLSRPVHYIRDAKPPLPASGFRQPDPTNFARPIIAPCQQCMTQLGDERRSMPLRVLVSLGLRTAAMLGGVPGDAFENKIELLRTSLESRASP